ncbi:MAG: alpha-(1-_3)-arabinofuranosyltransferase family protein, partial [Ilumatobacteraceae bacterium]
FGAYRWGYTVDPPLPGLTAKPLSTRDLLPWGSPAAMDLMYALDDRAQSNTLDPASIAPVARLFGADTIWVSNDMAFERFRTPRPELTNALFAAQPPGLEPPSTFGTPAPNVPALAMLDEAALADPAIGGAVPPVELVKVDDAVPMVRGASRLVVVSGSGDGIVDAAAAGLLHGDEALLYAADLRPTDQLGDADLVVITDSNRDRAHQWRGTQDVVGFTETGGPTTDVLQPDTADQRLPVFSDQGTEHETTAAVDGLQIRATSYGEPFAYRPEDRPAMAVDGDPATAWVVGDRSNPVGQSLEVTGDLSQMALLQSQQTGASRLISTVRLDFAGDGVDSAAAVQVVDLDETSLVGSGQRIAVPAGATFVRITIAGVTARPDGTDPGASAVGFAELGLGSHPEVVSVPTDASNVPVATPLAVVLTRLRTDPLNRWRSDPEPQIIRNVSIATDRDLTARFTLRRNDRASDAVLNRLAGVATATSNRRLTGDPQSTAAHAIDKDPTTSWSTPFSSVVGSRLQIPLDPTVATSTVDITQPIDQQHSIITSVRMTIGDQSIVVAVPAPDETGRSTLTFPSMTGTSLAMTIDTIDPVTTIDRRYAETTVLPAAISEIAAPSILAPQTLAAAPECHSDLVVVDGQPLPVSVDPSALSMLLAGRAVDVTPCDPAAIHLTAGPHRITTSPGLMSGLDVDRIVLQDATPTSPDLPATPAAPAVAPPTVDVQRSRTTRTATVTNCPTGCWLILGEGYNDGWEARAGSTDLGPPRRISGGFNGWKLTGSSTAVIVTMKWAPQRTMWIGMGLAGLAVFTCIALIVLDRRREALLVPAAPRSFWPPTDVGLRRSAVSAVALVVLAAVTISPKYGAIAAVIGVAILVFRRPLVAAAASLMLISGLAALIVRRQLRYRLVANPSWPAAFDDLHRLGLLVVVLLLVATLVDDCPDDPDEQLS